MNWSLNNRKNISEIQMGERCVIGGFLRSKIKFKDIVVGKLVDCTGHMKITFPKPLLEQLSVVKKESCLLVYGLPITPVGTENVEMEVSAFKVLSHALKPLPFDLSGKTPSLEHTYLKYRYLHLRTEFHRNLIIRSKITQACRDYLHKLNFIDIDTPLLSFSSLEGADVFKVITDKTKNNQEFFLSQSPQIYKQLLMIGGIEKYFQISKSFRQEDLRADRQFEFTQLDIEVSYKDREYICGLIEKLIIHALERCGLPIPKYSFSTMTYKDAWEKYSSDKPDLCNPLILERFQGNQGLWINKNHADSLEISKFKKIVSHTERTDSIFFSSTCPKTLCDFRNYIGQQLNLIKSELCFVWIIDWPLFEKKNNLWTSTHHPFTASKNNIISIDSLSTGYDLVLNGVEIASGSERIIDPQQIRETFSILQQSDISSIEWFLEAFEYGVPPHCGIAIGMDRFISLVLEQKTIRDVIAFPKNNHGICPLSK